MNAGYAIGFNGQDLASISETQNHTLAQCIYEEHIQVKYVENIVLQFIKLGATVYPSNLFDPGHDPDVNRMVSRFYMFLQVVAPLLKSCHFKEEREWRFIANIDLELDPEGELIPEATQMLGFRSGVSMLSPYYKLSLELEDNKKYLDEIVIGPTPNTTDSIEAVKLFCQINKIKVAHVLSSDIPFRCW